MELRALDGPPNDLADDPARKPIVRHNLHDAIVSRVRDMIIEGRLAPGARIHEGNLGQELGVSRTPLREALKYLASEGLLELSPGRGAVVRKFLAKDVQDSLIVLAHLESLAGRSRARAPQTTRSVRSAPCMTRCCGIMRCATASPISN